MGIEQVVGLIKLIEPRMIGTHDGPPAAGEPRHPSRQCSKGLASVGIVSPQTWTALIIQIKKGSSGDAVRGVQEEFQFRAGEPGKGLQVDGIFGPQTDSTVRGFQHALSLDIPSVVVDGIVGQVTWQALVSGMLSG